VRHGKRKSIMWVHVRHGKRKKYYIYEAWKEKKVLHMFMCGMERENVLHVWHGNRKSITYMRLGKRKKYYIHVRNGKRKKVLHTCAAWKERHRCPISCCVIPSNIKSPLGCA
jgi:hypothetical protein